MSSWSNCFQTEPFLVYFPFLNAASRQKQIMRSDVMSHGQKKKKKKTVFDQLSRKLSLSPVTSSANIFSALSFFLHSPSFSGGTSSDLSYRFLPWPSFFHMCNVRSKNDEEQEGLHLNWKGGNGRRELKCSKTICTQLNKWCFMSRVGLCLEFWMTSCRSGALCSQTWSGPSPGGTPKLSGNFRKGSRTHVRKKLHVIYLFIII